MPSDDARDRPSDTSDERGVHVRPFGYASPQPVVVRLGDRALFLGNGRAAEVGAHDRAFDAVCSLTADERPLTTHHRPLVDGPGAEWAAFEAAVDCARRLHDRDGSVLIHCEAGVSRSAAVAATTIAAAEDRSFRDALGIVQAARPHAMPHPALHELAVCYLAARR